MPESKQDNGLTLSNMRGISYYDAKWDELLDQIDYESDEIKDAFVCKWICIRQIILSW